MISSNMDFLPGQDQLEGAGNGIFLLQEAYNLNISELTRGIVQVKRMSEESFLSSASLKYVDTDFLGKIAYNRGFYDRAIEWFKAAADIASENNGLSKPKIANN